MFPVFKCFQYSNGVYSKTGPFPNWTRFKHSNSKLIQYSDQKYTQLVWFLVFQVAFVCNGDLWLHNSGIDQEVRLTYCHRGEGSSAITAGLPAYITQEEFSRFTGFWWRPCDQGIVHQFEILLKIKAINFLPVLTNIWFYSKFTP